MAPATEGPVGERIVDLPIIEELQTSYLTYSMSVIMARALPDARDGLKPSQRRILVAMNDLNLGPRAQHRKCAKIAGDTSGNYHPHGEQVIYPTLVRLAQPWNMRQPLIDGQGNFGSIDGDPPAAMRYTEARLDAAAVEMLGDLEYETVDFEPNYDNTRSEPVVLPSNFPNLLINGGSGIAVGMATNLMPHNVGEVCAAITAVIDNPHLSLPELMKIIPGPDFPTAGEICGRRGVLDAYSTGRGQITVRGRVLVEETRTGRQVLVITELPYQVLRSTVMEKIAAAIKAGHIKEVSSITDASDRKHPIRLEVELKKEANAQVVINQLYKYTPLQSDITIMNIALVERQPKTLPLRAMIDVYIQHRKEVIRRRTRFLLRKAQQRAHILEALLLCVVDIDRVIAIIRGSESPDVARERLMAERFQMGHTFRQIEGRMVAQAADKEAVRRRLPHMPQARFDWLFDSPHVLTAVQAQAILSMQLQRLTGLETGKLDTEYAKIAADIAEFESILADEGRVRDMIRGDLAELRSRFSDPRRTRISGPIEVFRMEELIADEQVVVTISHDGYIKRTDTDSYRRQARGGKGIRGSDTKEGDFIENLFVVSTHDFLLFFTNRGRVYWMRVYDVPAMSRTSRGRSIANLLQMQSGEAHRAVLPIKQFEEKFVFFATAKGVVKKTPLAAYSNPRPSGIIAITLDPDDDLINVEMTDVDHQIVLGTRNGMAIRFREENVRAMGRSARGVRGMSLEGDDAVVGMAAIRPEASLLTVCENGFGKRTSIEEYRLTHRGGKGVINIRTTERNGRVVDLKAVEVGDELMLITAAGIMLRTDLAELREIGRATQGVRLIRTGDEDRVVAVARIVREDEINGGPTADPADDAGEAPDTAPVDPEAAAPAEDAPDSPGDDAPADPDGLRE